MGVAWKLGGSGAAIGGFGEPFNSKIAAVIDAPARVRDAAGASVPLRVPALPITISSEPARDISLTLE